MKLESAKPNNFFILNSNRAKVEPDFLIFKLQELVFPNILLLIPLIYPLKPKKKKHSKNEDEVFKNIHEIKEELMPLSDIRI